MNLKSTLSMFAAALIFGFTACNSEEIASNTEASIQPTNEAAIDASATNPTGKIGNCAEVPGWASQNGGTTGGGSSAETTVTTYAQLKAAIENTAVKVIKVSGTITITTRLSFQDQTGKTIYGASGAKRFRQIRPKMLLELSTSKDAKTSSSET